MGLLILLLSLVFTWGQDYQMQKTNFSPTKNSQGDSLVDVKTVIDFKALDLLQSINSENSPLDSLAINKNSVSGISAEIKPQGKNIQYLLLLLDPISGESYANQKILLESKFLGITGADGTLELSLPYQENFQFFLGTDTLDLLESNFKTPTKQNFVQFILQAQKKATSVKTQVDVVVVAERQALHQRKVISKKVLKRQEMQEVAATQGDPLRTVHTLPGVSAQNDASVRPYVRGGDEKETRVFWNNIPIIQPYHAFSLYSVYNMEAVEKVDFYTGAFPVEGNNALSGAMFLKSRPAPLDTINTMAHISMLRGNAYVGVPVIDSTLGIYLAYQALWYDWVIKRMFDVTDLMIDNQDFEEAANNYQKFIDLPNFTDFEFGWNWKINSKLSLDYTGLLSNDLFRILDPREIQNGIDDIETTLTKIDTLALIDLQSQVHGTNLNWLISPQWKNQTTLAVQNQDWIVNFPNDDDDLYFDQNRTSYHARFHNIYQQSTSSILTFGLSYDYWEEHYNLDMPRFIYETLIRGNGDLMASLGYYDERGFTVTESQGYKELADFGSQIYMDIKGKHQLHFWGAYFSQEYHINQTNKLVHGIRLESESASSELFPAPRLAWYHQLSPNEELSIAVGMYSQNEFEFFYRHQNKSLTSEKSLHLNMEYSKDFSDYYRLEWSNYAKYYWNLASVSLVNKPPTSAAILNLLDKNYGIDTDSLRQSLSSSLEIDTTEIETVLDSATDLLLDVLSQEQQEMTSTIITESTLAYNNSGKGVAIGTELSFKYDPNPTWRGWLSFDCALSKRKDDNSGIWYNFDKHRPWSLKWHNYFNMGNAWTLSLKYSYTGGMAYTPYSDLGQLGKVDSTAQNPVLFEIEEKNSGHYSPYSRFDIRLSQETQFYSLHLTKFFEIWNAFNVPNMFLADHESNDIKNIDFNYPFPIFFLGAEMRW